MVQINHRTVNGIDYAATQDTVSPEVRQKLQTRLLTARHGVNRCGPLYKKTTERIRKRSQKLLSERGQKLPSERNESEIAVRDYRRIE